MSRRRRRTTGDDVRGDSHLECRIAALKPESGTGGAMIESAPGDATFVRM